MICLCVEKSYISSGKFLIFVLKKTFYMKKFRYTILCAIIVSVIASCSGYRAESVPGDPMNTRIYTLDNGLKVYMSVNKAEPRIQTYIAVKVGSKNDPSETTGLAHYFEHLMFKGTESFGTQNYEQEKPLLDQIEQKFEYYRTLTDEQERASVYAQIDSLSYEASKYAIPNEYDKLMSAIGANGSNAYTSYDMTVYVEDIPSNQIENWAKIQSDRFENCVIRGFHTELETVYEEKNMSLTDDMSKAYEALMSALIKHHPYGLQTVLGSQEHLKNPSIINIKNYYNEWYVPNNMAICLSGDFDPDEMIRTIDKYFGTLVPNENLKHLEFEPEEELTAPEYREVYGLEAESLFLGWRFDGSNSLQLDTLYILSRMLSNNGGVGIMDVNINQNQMALGAGSGIMPLADYSIFLMLGYPKQGQSLDELKVLFLEQLEQLKRGDFDESLIASTINNMKRFEMAGLEKNSSRANKYVQAFINDIPWKQAVSELDRLSKITKEDIVKFANRHFADNYAEVRKLQGEDTTVKKMPKPKITPIMTNRDTASAFMKEIQASTVEPIEPVFVDFEKDMKKLSAKQDIEVLYAENTTNSLFDLKLLYETGVNSDYVLGLALNYTDYLGTSKYTASEIKAKFYDLACDFRLYTANNRTYVTLAGLSENMEEAMSLMEEVLSDYKADEEILANMKADIFQSRINSKKEQYANFNRLQRYISEGPKNSANSVLSNDEVKNLKSETLLGKLSLLTDYAPIVLYYGPQKAEEVVEIFNREHKCSAELKQVADESPFKKQEVTEDKVYIAPYDSKQIYMLSYSNRGETYDYSRTPIVRLYNEYFAGGMNAIVFQEMREARGLAYSASASYSLGESKADAPYIFSTFIATQNDKLMDALGAFESIIEEMPQSEHALEIAKNNILTSIRTERVIGNAILWEYISNRKLGITGDRRKILFEQIPSLTMEDVVKFQQEVIKGRKYNIGILGNEKELNLKALKENGTFGQIVKLTQEDIFGY